MVSDASKQMKPCTFPFVSKYFRCSCNISALYVQLEWERLSVGVARGML